MFKNMLIQQVFNTHYVSGMVTRQMMTRTSSLHLRTPHLVKDVNKTKHWQQTYVCIHRMCQRSELKVTTSRAIRKRLKGGKNQAGP